MITSTEALDLAPKRQEPEEIELSGDERIVVDYIEAMIEGAIRKQFTGDIFEVRIPKQYTSDKLASVLKQRGANAGWLVGAFQNDPESLQVVFAPTGTIALGDQSLHESRATLKALPPVYNAPPVLVRPRRLLVRMPTRGRPAQALTMLTRYRSMAGCEITIEVVVDEDDATMLSAEVMQRLAALRCVVTVGQHKSKIEACNGGRVFDWDILVLASDDMCPVADNYAVRIIAAMEKHWPHLDGALFFNDGYQKSNLCTLPIFGRRLHDQFGYVYHPAYKSLFVDREQTDLLLAMGRLVYVDEKIIEHRHHVWGWGEKDELYQRNDALESEDRVTYEIRAAMAQPGAQWAFDSPPMMLSILICTVPDRRTQLEWLVDYLYGQILPWASRKVEIVIDDRINITVGQKRQDLLQRAKGAFIAFIDDDDGVAHDYVEHLLEVIRHDPTADCVSLDGVMTTNGSRPEIFTHSKSCEVWHSEAGKHFRSPNHLNAVRRELALEVGFLPKNTGEDFDFSTRLRPLLKEEANAGSDPLYFYWHIPTKSVQKTADSK